MKYNLIAEMEDGSTFIVSADARDLRKWEAVTGGSWMGTKFGLTHLAQLAYYALVRTGQMAGRYPSYEDFDAMCVNVTGGSDEPTGDDMSVVASPTQPEVTDGFSAP